MLMWALTLASVFVCYFLSLRYKARKKIFLIFSGILIVVLIIVRYFICKPIYEISTTHDSHNKYSGKN